MKRCHREVMAPQGFYFKISTHSAAVFPRQTILSLGTVALERLWNIGCSHWKYRGVSTSSHSGLSLCVNEFTELLLLIFNLFWCFSHWIDDTISLCTIAVNQKMERKIFLQSRKQHNWNTDLCLFFSYFLSCEHNSQRICTSTRSEYWALPLWFSVSCWCWAPLQVLSKPLFWPEIVI